jgi:hypothetical protein
MKQINPPLDQKYLTFGDFVDLVYVFGYKNKHYIKENLRKLGIYNPIFTLNDFNSTFFKNLKYFLNDDKNTKRILFLKDNVHFHSKIVDYCWLTNNNVPSNFDVFLVGYEGKISLGEKINYFTFNLPNPDNIELKLIKNYNEINDIYGLVLNKDFILNLNNEVNSIEDILKNTNSNHIILAPTIKYFETDINDSNYVPIVQKDLNIFKFRQLNEHFGDSIWYITFFNKLLKKYSEISIYYYVRGHYLYELNKLKTSNRLQLFDIKDLNEDIPFIHFGQDDSVLETAQKFSFQFSKIKQYYFNDFLKKHFNINNFEFSEDETFYENDDIKNNYNFEFLIVNSNSMALNFATETEKLNELFEILADKLNELNVKFITTEKIKDYPCTRELAPNFIDIFNLSQNLNYIVGMDTGPVNVAVNKNNLYKLKKFIILNTNGWNYNNYKNSMAIFSTKDFENLINNLGDFLNGN